MQSLFKLFFYKIIIVLSMIIIFAIIYKLLLRNKYSWGQTFFASCLNQTFTTNIINEPIIRFPLIIQNLTSFFIVVGVFTMLMNK